MQHPDQYSPKRPLRLEDIEKKNVFSIPEGYFDRLPSQIGARITEERRPLWRWSTVKWIPVSFASVLCLLLGIWFFRPHAQSNSESNLAHITDQEIIHYLGESDLSPNDLIETTSQVDLKVEGNLLQNLAVPEDELLNQVETQELDELI